MSHNIIDEYLVRLGFDADSSQGKEFANTYKQIQDQMNQSDNSAQRSEQNAQRRYDNQKSRNQSVKGQYAWIADVEKAFNSLHRTASSFASGNPLGGAFNAYRTYQMSKTMFNGTTFGKSFQKDSQSEARTPPSRNTSAPRTNTLDDIIRQIMNDTGQIAHNTASGGSQGGSPTTPRNEQDWIDHVVNQVQSGNIPRSKNGSLNWSGVQKYIKEFQDQNRGSANTFKSENLSSGASISPVSGGDGLAVGGEEALAAGAGDAGGASGMAAGLASSVVPAVAIAGAAAALVAGAAAAYKMADGLAQANVNVESIARSFWMTTNDAWQMTNVLSAMGKTTNDLASIAANPALRQQYQDLQRYQQEYATLPKDFQEMNDLWTSGVTTQADELKMSLEYMREMAGYDLEKILVGPLSEALNVINKMAEGANKVMQFFSWLYGGDQTGKSDSSSYNSDWEKDKEGQEYLKDYRYSWQSPAPSGNYYIPNSSSTSNNSTMSVTHAPAITNNIYANGNDAKSIGDAASSGTTQAEAQSQFMLLKHLKGVK